MHLPRLKNRLAPLSTSLIRPRSWQPPGGLAFLCVTCSQCRSAVVSVTLLKTFGVLWVQSIFERVAYEARFIILGWICAVFGLLTKQGRGLVAFAHELGDDLLRVEDEAGVKE